jgi:hypothetical protein
VEKVEREKAQRFHNLLCKKLAGLRNDVENQLPRSAGNVSNFLLPTL